MCQKSIVLLLSGIQGRIEVEKLSENALAVETVPDEIELSA